MPSPHTNVLYFGNNLSVLREKIADESVDICYCDPPFNGNRNFFVLFKDRTGKASLLGYKAREQQKGTAQKDLLRETETGRYKP